MRTRYHLLPVLLVLVTAGTAHPFTISQFFSSNGSTSASPEGSFAVKSSGNVSGYAVPAGVKLRKEVTYKYYPVSGRTYSEVVDSAEDNGPFADSNNAHVTSKINWGLQISCHYDYDYEVDEESGYAHVTIDISDVAVKYDVVVTLPALRDNSRLNAADRRLWRDYVQRLLDKEHGRIATIEDAETRGKMESAIDDIKGFSFDLAADKNGLDKNAIEQAVEAYLQEKTREIGKQGIKSIKENLFQFDRKQGYTFTISQFFDSSGNPLSSPPRNADSDIARRAARYAVPEGVVLHKDITYEYYLVFGRSFSEIVNSAAENGPLVKGRNARVTSKMNWDLGISYHYDYDYEIDKESKTVHVTVDISDIAIKYDVAVTLPALLDDSPLDAVEKRLWRNYFQRLVEREHSRVAVIEDAGIRKKMESDIDDIKDVSFDYTDEDDIQHSVELYLEEETRLIGSRWIKKLRENLAQYDLGRGATGNPDELSLEQHER